MSEGLLTADGRHWRGVRAPPGKDSQRSENTTRNHSAGETEHHKDRRPLSMAPTAQPGVFKRSNALRVECASPRNLGSL